MTSHKTMLLGLVAGAALGSTANALGGGTRALEWTLTYVTQPVGQIFLRLLFMLVLPLLFSALVMGVAELELKRLGRMGARAFGYTVVVSLIAVLIGIVLVNVIRPGDGLGEAAKQLAGTTGIKAATPPPDSSPVALIIGMVPENVARAASGGDILAVIFFSLIFGIGLSLTETEASTRLREGIQGLFDVTMRILDGVIKLAPIGVGALLFTMTAKLGADVLRQLAAYVLVVLLALGIHMFVVYSLSVKFFGGMNPIDFFRRSRLAMATAFSTASSNATLPTALKVAEEELKLPREVGRFVLTTGAAMNQNGTALFEGVTVLFLAQVYGVDLTLAQQFVVVLVCVLGGIGTAGVPAGSLPVVAMILGLVGVPAEGLGLVIGVDRFLDMCRTTLNVTGDLAAAVFVARGEKQT